MKKLNRKSRTKMLSKESRMKKLKRKSTTKMLSKESKMKKLNRKSTTKLYRKSTMKRLKRMSRQIQAARGLSFGTAGMIQDP